MIIGAGEDVKITITHYAPSVIDDINQRAKSEPDVTVTITGEETDDISITLEGEFGGIITALWGYIDAEDPIAELQWVLSEMERV